MNKEERIFKYGKEAYAKLLSQRRELYRKNYEREKAVAKKWRLANPERVEAQIHAQSRKGGKHYKRFMCYKQTGIPWEREKIRMHHGNRWRHYKRIIAPDSQIHHEWIHGTSNYKGVALVEKEPHQQGIIKVIMILDGEIKLFSEEEIRRQ